MRTQPENKKPANAPHSENIREEYSNPHGYKSEFFSSGKFSLMLRDTVKKANEKQPTK